MRQFKSTARDEDVVQSYEATPARSSSRLPDTLPTNKPGAINKSKQTLGATNGRDVAGKSPPKTRTNKNEEEARDPAPSLDRMTRPTSTQRRRRRRSASNSKSPGRIGLASSRRGRRRPQQQQEQQQYQQQEGIRELKRDAELCWDTDLKQPSQSALNASIPQRRASSAYTPRTQPRLGNPNKTSPLRHRGYRPRQGVVMITGSSSMYSPSSLQDDAVLDARSVDTGASPRSSQQEPSSLQEPNDGASTTTSQVWYPSVIPSCSSSMSMSCVPSHLRSTLRGDLVVMSGSSNGSNNGGGRLETDANEEESIRTFVYQDTRPIPESKNDPSQDLETETRVMSNTNFHKQRTVSDLRPGGSRTWRSRSQPRPYSMQRGGTSLSRQEEHSYNYSSRRMSGRQRSSLTSSWWEDPIQIFTATSNTGPFHKQHEVQQQRQRRQQHERLLQNSRVHKKKLKPYSNDGNPAKVPFRRNAKSLSPRRERLETESESSTVSQSVPSESSASVETREPAAEEDTQTLAVVPPETSCFEADESSKSLLSTTWSGFLAFSSSLTPSFSSNKTSNSASYSLLPTSSPPSSEPKPGNSATSEPELSVPSPETQEEDHTQVKEKQEAESSDPEPGKSSNTSSASRMVESASTAAFQMVKNSLWGRSAPRKKPTTLVDGLGQEESKLNQIGTNGSCDDPSNDPVETPLVLGATDPDPTDTPNDMPTNTEASEPPQVQKCLDAKEKTEHALPTKPLLETFQDSPPQDDEIHRSAESTVELPTTTVSREDEVEEKTEIETSLDADPTVLMDGEMVTEVRDLLPEGLDAAEQESRRPLIGEGVFSFKMLRRGFARTGKNKKGDGEKEIESEVETDEARDSLEAKAGSKLSSIPHPNTNGEKDMAEASGIEVEPSSSLIDNSFTDDRSALSLSKSLSLSPSDSMLGSGNGALNSVLDSKRSTSPSAAVPPLSGFDSAVSRTKVDGHETSQIDNGDDTKSIDEMELQNPSDELDGASATISEQDDKQTDTSVEPSMSLDKKVPEPPSSPLEINNGVDSVPVEGTLEENSSKSIDEEDTADVCANKEEGFVAHDNESTVVSTDNDPGDNHGEDNKIGPNEDDHVQEFELADHEEGASLTSSMVVTTGKRHNLKTVAACLRRPSSFKPVHRGGFSSLFRQGGKSSSASVSQGRRDPYVRAWDMEQEDDFSSTSIVSHDTGSLSRDQAFDSSSTEVNSTTKNVPLPETTGSGEGTLLETVPHDETRDSKLGDMDLLPCWSRDDDAEQNPRDQPLHTDDEERTPMEVAIREMVQKKMNAAPDEKTGLEGQFSTSHEKLGDDSDDNVTALEKKTDDEKEREPLLVLHRSKGSAASDVGAGTGKPGSHGTGGALSRLSRTFSFFRSRSSMGGSKKEGVPRQKKQERDEEINGSDPKIPATNSAPDTSTSDATVEGKTNPNDEPQEDIDNVHSDEESLAMWSVATVETGHTSNSHTHDEVIRTRSRSPLQDENETTDKQESGAGSSEVSPSTVSTRNERVKSSPSLGELEKRRRVLTRGRKSIQKDTKKRKNQRLLVTRVEDNCLWSAFGLTSGTNENSHLDALVEDGDYDEDNNHSSYMDDDETLDSSRFSDFTSEADRSISSGYTQDVGPLVLCTHAADCVNGEGPPLLTHAQHQDNQSTVSDSTPGAENERFVNHFSLSAVSEASLEEDKDDGSSSYAMRADTSNEMLLTPKPPISSPRDTAKHSNSVDDSGEPDASMTQSPSLGFDHKLDVAAPSAQPASVTTGPSKPKKNHLRNLHDFNVTMDEIVEKDVPNKAAPKEDDSVNYDDDDEAFEEYNDTILPLFQTVGIRSSTHDKQSPKLDSLPASSSNTDTKYHTMDCLLDDDDSKSSCATSSSVSTYADLPHRDPFLLMDHMWKQSSPSSSQERYARNQRRRYASKQRAAGRKPHVLSSSTSRGTRKSTATKEQESTSFFSASSRQTNSSSSFGFP